MTVRLLGGAIILLVSAFSARSMISAEEKRIRELEAFIKLITYIRDQIDCYSTPIGKIFSEYGGISELSPDCIPADLEDLLLNGRFSIGDESLKTLSEFSKTLGKNYRETQIKLCSKAVSELEAQKNALVNALPARKKTIFAICLSVGGVAVIALI